MICNKRKRLCDTNFFNEVSTQIFFVTFFFALSGNRSSVCYRSCNSRNFIALRTYGVQYTGTVPVPPKAKAKRVCWRTGTVRYRTVYERHASAHRKAGEGSHSCSCCSAQISVVPSALRVSGVTPHVRRLFTKCVRIPFSLSKPRPKLLLGTRPVGRCRQSHFSASIWNWMHLPFRLNSFIGVNDKDKATTTMTTASAALNSPINALLISAAATIIFGTALAYFLLKSNK